MKRVRSTSGVELIGLESTTYVCGIAVKWNLCRQVDTQLYQYVCVGKSLLVLFERTVLIRMPVLLRSGLFDACT